jgi:hypothetical protein
MTFSKNILLLVMLIGWAFSTQAAALEVFEVTLESFKITKTREKTSDNKLHGEYRLSFGKKGEQLQTHCFDHSMEFDPNQIDGWVGYQAKALSGCAEPKVVYGKWLKLREEFVLNRDFYKKSRNRFYRYSCDKDPPGLGNSSKHLIFSNEIDMLVYKECSKRSKNKNFSRNPTPYFEAKKTHGSQKVRLYSPIKVTEKEALQLCFFEMDFLIKKGGWEISNHANRQDTYFRIYPFFPKHPTKIKPGYTYATHDYYRQFHNKEWSKKPKNLVPTCFELNAKTLLAQADKNNRVVLRLTSGTGKNEQRAEIALSIKQVLPKQVTSLIKAFSEQLSDRQTREQFIAAQNNWAVSYDSDNPSQKDKARSKTLKFPFSKATQIILHSRLLKDNQWVLPQKQLIGFLKEWILKKDREAYLVFKQNNQLIQGIRPLTLPGGTAQPIYQTLLSDYDVQIQWQQQTKPFSAKDLDIITQAWILNQDTNATVWLYKRNNNQPIAVFALKALGLKMPQPPKGIYNPKIYFSQSPPTGLENSWNIGKTRFFQATLKWLKTKDQKAWLTFEDNRRNTLINTIAAAAYLSEDFDIQDLPTHNNLTASIPKGLDFEALSQLAMVKMSRGPFSRQYPLSNTIELPKGHYNLSDFEIAVAYKKPWVAHLLDETRTGNRITLAYQTAFLPKLTINSPDEALTDADWKKYCRLEQHQDANKLFKALSEGEAKVNCYPLLVKNSVVPVEFRKSDRTIRFNLQKGISFTEVKLEMKRPDLGDWYLTDGKTTFLFTEVFRNAYTRLIDLMSKYEKSPKEVLQTTWYLTKEEVAQRYRQAFSLKEKRKHSFDTLTPKPFFKTALLPNSVWSSLRFEVTKKGRSQVWKNCQIKTETQFLCDDQKSLMLTDFIGATLQIQGLPDSNLTFSSDKQEAKLPLTAIRCGQWSKIFPLSEDRLFFQKSNANCDSIKTDFFSIKGSFRKARTLSNSLCTFKTFNRKEMPTEQLKSQATQLSYQVVTAAVPNLGDSQDVFCNHPPCSATVNCCDQQSDNKWLHLMFINSDGNWRKYYLAQKRKQFIRALQARFPNDVGLFIWFLSQPNRDEPAKLMPFKKALKKAEDLRDYQQAYKHLIRLPRKRGDSLPIDNQIARSLNLLKLQIEASKKLQACDQHAVILLTNGLNANTASSQIVPHLPDWHHLVVLAGEEADQSQLKGISLGGKVKFIPLNLNGKWREALVQQIESIW